MLRFLLLGWCCSYARCERGAAALRKRRASHRCALLQTRRGSLFRCCRLCWVCRRVAVLYALESVRACVSGWQVGQGLSLAGGRGAERAVGGGQQRSGRRLRAFRLEPAQLASPPLPPPDHCVHFQLAQRPFPLPDCAGCSQQRSHKRSGRPVRQAGGPRPPPDPLSGT